MLIVGVLIGLIVVWAIVGIIACFYDKKQGTQFSCRHWGWHNGRGDAVGFDGASFTARCSKCNLRVLRDSQGNWFPSSIQ